MTHETVQRVCALTVRGTIEVVDNTDYDAPPPNVSGSHQSWVRARCERDARL